MKCFMPVYALVLALAVTSDMVQQVSAANCVESDVCTTASSCETVADGTTAATVARPAIGVLAACPTGTFAYIKSLVIVPGAGTTASSIKVRFSTTSAEVDATATPATPDVTPACDSTYSNLGSDATADVKATIGCATGTTCVFKYKATYACQPVSCATTCTDATKCIQKNLIKDATLELARPVVADLAACATGKYAYLSSLEVGVTGTTKASDLTVAFSAGTPATVLTSTKDTSVCAARWADVGKTTTADMKAVITCTASAGCDFKHKSVWVCQTDVVTPAPTTATPTATSVTPNGTTPAPTNATSSPAAKSGVATLAGANPVVVWGTALVAAVAGANFVAPL